MTSDFLISPPPMLSFLPSWMQGLRSLDGTNTEAQPFSSRDGFIWSLLCSQKASVYKALLSTSCHNRLFPGAPAEADQESLELSGRSKWAETTSSVTTRTGEELPLGSQVNKQAASCLSDHTCNIATFSLYSSCLLSHESAHADHLLPSPECVDP